MSGSSPLTRGKRITQAAGIRRFGLIPTHAGKTAASRTRLEQSQAHPHSRGENRAEDVNANFAEGSSPLTRGKL